MTEEQMWQLITSIAEVIPTTNNWKCYLKHIKTGEESFCFNNTTNPMAAYCAAREKGWVKK